MTTGVAFCGVVGHPHRHEYTGKDFFESMFLQYTHIYIIYIYIYIYIL